ncbi:class I SAM-dependent methyltransferase [Clostridium sp. 'deep sea']|uniref:class I SAM-dependent methyltransferase n=1 Tax=Clostridium sp. 'deep sea' TaxID=2779445 RepID=UPI0018969EB5|nr:class I SAM-dependent methyltransferase [Clostridium sp. 'deep sea']QOR35007.1 class I SAM-dependent methyltransferase [Clostridium sp. 'deep sea']
MKKKIEKNWNSMVDAYEQFTNKPSSYSLAIEWPSIKQLLPNIQNKKILDLGCGSGRFSFLLESLNPRKITAIDLSQQMLNKAKEIANTKQSKVEFLTADIENLSILEDNSYDLVFSSTTLHYLPQLNKIMSEIQRVLVLNGVCILSVIHPIYTSHYPLAQNNEFPKDDDWQVRYLNKELRAYVQPWIEFNDNIKNYLSISYHHTFADYVNNAINVNLNIISVSEPEPPKQWSIDTPTRYTGFINTPTYLIIKLQKSF